MATIIRDTLNASMDSQPELSSERLRDFARLLRVFNSRCEEDRAGILAMAEIADDPNASPDEIDAALATMVEGLFPSEAADLSATAAFGEVEVTDRMDQEEAKFARRLGKLMKSKGISQAELADAIGVGQPAISMMLSRNCRPQRRTLERLARALDVDVQRLWPVRDRSGRQARKVDQSRARS